MLSSFPHQCWGRWPPCTWNLTSLGLRTAHDSSKGSRSPRKGQGHYPHLPGSWGVNLNTSLVDSLRLLFSLSSYKKGDPVIAPKNRSPVTRLSVIHGSQYLPGLQTDHSQVSTSSDTMWSPPRPLLEEQPPTIPSVGFLTPPRLRLGGKGLRDNLADIGPS